MSIDTDYGQLLKIVSWFFLLAVVVGLALASYDKIVDEVKDAIGSLRQIVYDILDALHK